MRCELLLGLAGNGVLTVGDDMEMAFLRMELVEHFANIVRLARQMGDLVELPSEMVSKLLAARTKAGLGRAARQGKPARWSRTSGPKRPGHKASASPAERVSRARASTGTGPPQAMTPRSERSR